VRANLADPRGQVKRRPSIIATSTDAIRSEQPFVVIAVSTSYPDPPPEDHVELPWNADRRRVRTRLNRRCAAVITWLRTITSEDVDDFAGEVPPALMITILQKLKATGGWTE
jgi:mRNA-degrading endonuclease toxin of MazEF toxin-antitoxin module